jgi:hypothetical protein
MAGILVNDLQPQDSDQSLISLKETELGLLKNAVERAIDARQVIGNSLFLPRPFGRTLRE